MNWWPDFFLAVISPFAAWGTIVVAKEFTRWFRNAPWRLYRTEERLFYWLLNRHTRRDAGEKHTPMHEPCPRYVNYTGSGLPRWIRRATQKRVARTDQ